MPAKSLLRIAVEACIVSVRKIDDVGDAPYHIVRPVLLKVDNPQQLRDIEKNSPQICGADAEIWLSFIKRDIRNWQKRQMEPKNPQNWFKVYRKLQKEDEEQIREAQEKLKADMDSRKAEKQNNQMGFVDRVIDPVRKGPPRQRTTADRTANMSSLHFGSGSRTSAATGKSTMNKVKREAREASLFGARKTALSTPTHLLNQKSSQGRIVGPRTTSGDYDAPLAQVPFSAGSKPVGIRGNLTTQLSGHTQPSPAQILARPSPQKRSAASVFIPAKKRRM